MLELEIIRGASEISVTALAAPTAPHISSEIRTS
jgi:hypothetical protein